MGFWDFFKGGSIDSKAKHTQTAAQERPRSLTAQLYNKIVAPSVSDSQRAAMAAQVFAGMYAC